MEFFSLVLREMLRCLYIKFVFVTEIEWSDWSECSVTCGTGRQSRYSRCVDDGSRLELCMEAGGERTETRTCNREVCTTSTSTTTEVAGGVHTSQSLPDMFFPPLTNNTSPQTVAERRQPGQHKHRKFHHKNSGYKNVGTNSSLVNVSEWGVGKFRELAVSGEGEYPVTAISKLKFEFRFMNTTEMMCYTLTFWRRTFCFKF
jgi:Thrombospondin type 1 domain.